MNLANGIGMDEERNMKLEWLAGEYAVCQASDFSLVDGRAEFLFLAKTDQEYSIVCRADQVPANCLSVEPGWLACRIAGVLDFSLIGVLARITAILAAQEISVFVVSTFNTDYFLVKRAKQAQAVAALSRAGYETTTRGELT